MTKAQIHFSNSLPYLLEILKSQLFPKGSGPFEKRLVVVPHMALKDWIMQGCAKDPQMQVAAGLKIASVDQAYHLLTKKILPSKMELSFFLQHELMGMIGQVEELRTYFDLSAKQERIGPFCDVLSTYFLRYKTYGKPKLPAWQEELYAKLPWVFPSEFRCKTKAWDVHLFGFSYLPKTTVDFFERQGAKMYCISPCEIFWGDFYSEKELITLGKKVVEGQLNLFAQAFEDQNPLLANWGKVGRQMHSIVEDIPSKETYREFGQDSALSTLKQALLEGKVVESVADESIQFVSASSRFREVEILKDFLIDLIDKKGVEPKDIQVFAPDLSSYAPFIEAVFQDLDYTSVGVDPKQQAFEQLLAFPKRRFSKEHLLKLLPHVLDTIDQQSVKRWIDAAQISWGFSKDQRRVIYLRDLQETDLHLLPERGTWLDGFFRLIRGLWEVGDQACVAVSMAELEEFNLFYKTVCDLAEDLAPLLDGTKWTIPTWLRYLACLMESYLQVDPSHKLHKELLRLASKADHLDQHTVSFEEIERVVSSQKPKMEQAFHLQTIRFATLSDGCILPSRVVAFLGMNEEVFPKKEQNASLYFGELDFRPKQTDLDQYLFLQGLLHTEEYLFLSYVRDEEGKRGASILYEELKNQLQGAQVLHHPELATNPRYFGGDLVSYNKEAFSIASEKIQPKPKSPLIPSFYHRVAFEKPHERSICLRDLFQFAKHPLRYYLHKVLGIYPNFNKSQSKGVLLDPLKRRKLVEKALKGCNIEDQLPESLFSLLARSQIESEVNEWKEAASGLPIRAKKVEFAIGPYIIKGEIDSMTEKGWLLRGKNTLEDQVCFYPQLLLAKELNIPVIFICDLSSPQIDGTLESYLDYFCFGNEHPSPMLPKLSKALLENDAAVLEKGMKQIEDEVWKYLCHRDPFPDASTILQNWRPQLQRTFGGIHAKV